MLLAKEKKHYLRQNHHIISLMLIWQLLIRWLCWLKSSWLVDWEFFFEESDIKLGWGEGNIYLNKTIVDLFGHKKFLDKKNGMINWGGGKKLKLTKICGVRNLEELLIGYPTPIVKLRIRNVTLFNLYILNVYHKVWIIVNFYEQLLWVRDVYAVSTD